MLRNIRQARPPRPAQGPGSLASGDIGYGGKESKPRSKRIYYLLFLIPVAVTVWSFLHNHGDVMSSVTPAGVPPIMRFTAPTAARRESIETQRPTAGSLFVRSPSPSPASEALSSPPPPPPPPPPRRRPAKSPPPAEPPPPAPIPSPAKPPVRIPDWRPGLSCEPFPGLDLLARSAEDAPAAAAMLWSSPV